VGAMDVSVPAPAAAVSCARRCSAGSELSAR
jgi:hypothetical protein